MRSPISSGLLCNNTSREGQGGLIFLLSDVLGAGEPQAEGEGGAGETTGSAGALQEVFDITQHSLGQGAGQRAHAEVTSEAESVTTAKPGVPLHVKHLKEAVVSGHLSVFSQAGSIQRLNFGEKNPPLAKTPS